MIPVSPRLRRLAALLAAAVAPDSPGGATITPEEREELAEAMPELRAQIQALPTTSGPARPTPAPTAALSPEGRPPRLGQAPAAPAPEPSTPSPTLPPVVAPAPAPTSPAPAPASTTGSGRLTIVTTGSPPPALAKRVLAIVFSHEEDAPSRTFVVPRTIVDVQALIPSWKAHADAMHALGIPVTRCIPPGLAKLYASVPEMRDYYAYAAARGFQFAGRAHEGSVLGNAADAAYWLAQGGAPPCDVNGTWTAGTVPDHPLASVHGYGKLTWTAAIGGGATPGHEADAKIDGIEVFAPGRIGIYTGTANNTASMKGAAADAAGKPIRYTMGGSPLYVDTTSYNVLTRIDGKSAGLSAPVRHAGSTGEDGHTEQSGVLIVDDLAKTIASLGEFHPFVHFTTPQEIAATWTGGSYTYEVYQS